MPGLDVGFRGDNGAAETLNVGSYLFELVVHGRLLARRDAGVSSEPQHVFLCFAFRSARRARMPARARTASWRVGVRRATFESSTHDHTHRTFMLCSKGIRSPKLLNECVRLQAEDYRLRCVSWIIAK